MRYGDSEKIYENGLCTGCGICSAICPKQCIDMQISGYELHPVIDRSICVGCGMCEKVCSTYALSDEKGAGPENMAGKIKQILCVKAKDKELLKAGQSGGVVSSLVKALLADHSYDCAFLVPNDTAAVPAKTTRFTEPDTAKKTAGSRYVTILHEEAARYICEHPDERVIIVATGCVVRTFKRMTAMKGLDPDNYLFIGLFCDKTMNYGVTDYFRKHPAGEGRELKNIIYRCKEAGGWPGKLRLVYEGGGIEDLPVKERSKIKDYFMPEKCLYCLDKLNRECDIAAGDNYIPGRKDREGISSVLIRSDKGAEIWSKTESLFETDTDAPEELYASQHLDEKLRNYKNGIIKGVYEDKDTSISKNDREAYEALKRIISVRDADSRNIYKSINNDIERITRRRVIRRYTSLPGRAVKKLIKLIKK